MKLIDLLAKNLTEWPSDAAYLSQAFTGRVVRHSESGMPLGDVSINVALAEDWNGSTVTKLQWLSTQPPRPEVGVLIGYGDGPVTPLYVGVDVFVYRDESGDECYDSPYKRSDFYKYVDPWVACEAAIRAAVANGDDFKGIVDEYVNGI